MINNEGPCQQVTGGPFYAPCHHIQHEEFLGQVTPAEALQACNTWAASKSEPDGGCFGVGSLGNLQWREGGWFRWVEPNNSLIWWFGIFWYGNCPDGTMLDSDEGCIPIEEDEGECDGDDGTKIGKSINTATGNEYHKENLEIGNGLDISLSYNSHIRINEYGKIDINKLAPGWTMSVNMYISPVYTTNTEKHVLVHRGNGRYFTYVYNETAMQWQSDQSDKAILEQMSTGWKLISKSGTIETYAGDVTGAKIETIEKTTLLSPSLIVVNILIKFKIDLVILSSLPIVHQVVATERDIQK